MPPPIPSNLNMKSPQPPKEQSLIQRVKTENPELKSPPSSVTDGSRQDTESTQGQQEGSGSSEGLNGEVGSGEETEGQASNQGSGTHRKRKRSRKGLDKKYHCSHEGCAKSYSRAEHLYRHQLNRKSHQSHIRSYLLTCANETHPSTFTIAIILAVVGGSLDKTCVPVTRNVTPIGAHTCNAKIPTCSRPVTGIRQHTLLHSNMHHLILPFQCYKAVMEVHQRNLPLSKGPTFLQPP